MDKQLERIEKKLDQVIEHQTSHLERITRVETSNYWLKWSLSVLISLVGTTALAFTKLFERP